MRLTALFAAFASLIFTASANAQSLNIPAKPYARISLNTALTFDLEENAAGTIATADVDPGIGGQVAFGAEITPDFSIEAEVGLLQGEVATRTVLGATVTSSPADEIQLTTGMLVGYFHLQPAVNTRIRLGAGVGAGRVVIDERSTALTYNGRGLAYQVKAQAEYDVTPNFVFTGELGYLGTSEYDVYHGAINVNTEMSAITGGIGGRFKF